MICWVIGGGGKVHARKPLFLAYCVSLKEHKVNIGEIGKRAWPATNPDTQDRDTETASIGKEKLSVRSMEIEVGKDAEGNRSSDSSLRFTGTALLMKKLLY